MVLSTLAGASRTATAFDRFLDASDAADVQLQYSSDGAVDDELLAALRADPHIAVAAPLYITVGFSKRSGYDLGLFASPGRELFRDIDRPRILEGRLPDPAAADELLINRFTQHNLDVEVGDTVRVGTFSADQFGGEGPSGEPAGPVLDMQVVGIGVTPYDVADEEFVGAFATPAYFAAHWGKVGGFGPTIEIATRGAGDPLAVVRHAIARFDLQEVILTPASDLTAKVDAGTRVLATGLTIFALVAGLAALVACAQALHRRVADAGRDQPALRAMGLSRAQRVGAIGLAIAPTVVAGAALAVVLAAPASVIMPIGDARRAEPHPGLDVDATVFALGALSLLIILAVVGALGAWRVAQRDGQGGAEETDRRPRTTPIRFLRNRLSPPIDLGVSLALDRGARSAAMPVRSALVGAALGAAGIVAVITFGTSLDALVSTPARSGWNWTFAPDVGPEDEATLLAIPGIQDVGVVQLRKLVIDGQQVQGVSMQAERGSPSLTVLRGRMPVGPREIAVGPALADRSHLHLGDRVRAVDHAAGGTTRDGTTRDMVVVGEVLLPTFDDNPFNDGVAVAPTVIGDLADSDGFGQAVVTFAPTVSAAEARHRMTAALPASMSVYAFPSPPPDVANLAAVRFLPRLLGVFLGLLALAAVGHALATSLRRRRHDISIVRALGFVGRDVARTISAQSLTLMVIGLAAGVPLGLAIGRVSWRMVADGIGVSSQPTTPPVALVTLGAAALVAGLVLAAFPGRMAARLSTVEALRAE